jgi:hypothetical protein
MRSGWAYRSLRIALLGATVAAMVGHPQRAEKLIAISLFDGTLNGWDGDPAYWRVENGAIVGETKPGGIPKQNTFLIWRNGMPGDFDLHTEYRITGGNSGIQYRSVELPDIRWAMKGYQADIDAEQKYTGQIYEERGRGFLALRGQSAAIETGHKPVILGTLGSDAELKGAIHAPGWNDYEIIARGNVMVQILNGRVMSMLVDDDTENRKANGLIGIQLHAGEPMKIEVRKMWIQSY